MNRLVVFLALTTVTLKPGPAKAQPTPTLAWAIPAGGKITEFASQCVADSLGNDYLAGAFNSDGTLGDFRVTAPTNSGRSFLAKVDGRGKVMWFRNFGGEMSFVQGMHADPAGNVLVTGNFLSQAVFGAQQLKIHSASALNFYVAKYDPQGNALWCREAHGKTEDDIIAGSRVVADSSGNCLVSGNFLGQVNLGSTSLASSQKSALFLAKYDAQGTLLWVVQGGGSSQVSTAGVAADRSGNCFLVGTVGAFYDPTNSHSSLTLGNKRLVSHGKEDLFVAKFTPGGELSWAETAGGPSNDEVLSVAVDESGDCYLTGDVSGPAQFGSLEARLHGESDIFVGKIGANGQWRWLKTAGGRGGWEKGIYVHAAEGGGCYLVAEISGKVLFEGTSVSTPAPWRRTLCLAKYSPEGDTLWAYPLSVPAADQMASAKLTPVGMGRSGTLYTSGTFESSVLVGTNQFTSAGGMDFFLAKISFAP